MLNSEACHINKTNGTAQIVTPGISTDGRTEEGEDMRVVEMFSKITLRKC